MFGNLCKNWVDDGRPTLWIGTVFLKINFHVIRHFFVYFHACTVQWCTLHHHDHLCTPWSTRRPPRSCCTCSSTSCTTLIGPGGFLMKKKILHRSCRRYNEKDVMIRKLDYRRHQLHFPRDNVVHCGPANIFIMKIV